MKNTAKNRQDIARILVSKMTTEALESLVMLQLCAEWEESEVLFRVALAEGAHMLGCEDGEAGVPGRSSHDDYLDGYDEGYKAAEEAADERHAEWKAEEALYKED